MPTFRYYLLDANNKITGADFLEATDLNTAIWEASTISDSSVPDGVCGFEIWQNHQLLHQAATKARLRSPNGPEPG